MWLTIWLNFFYDFYFLLTIYLFFHLSPPSFSPAIGLNAVSLCHLFIPTDSEVIHFVFSLLVDFLGNSVSHLHSPCQASHWLPIFQTILSKMFAQQTASEDRDNFYLEKRAALFSMHYNKDHSISSGAKVKLPVLQKRFRFSKLKAP